MIRCFELKLFWGKKYQWGGGWLNVPSRVVNMMRKHRSCKWRWSWTFCMIINWYFSQCRHGYSTFFRSKQNMFLNLQKLQHPRPDAPSSFLHCTVTCNQIKWTAFDETMSFLLVYLSLFLKCCLSSLFLLHWWEMNQLVWWVMVKAG